jgi:hypothetical protein
VRFAQLINDKAKMMTQHEAIEEQYDLFMWLN